MKKVLLLTISSLILNSAFGADWVLVFVDKNNGIYNFLDKSSIQKISKYNKRAWSRYIAYNASGVAVMEFLTLHEYNCAGKQSRVIQSIQRVPYYSDVIVNYPWSNIAPNTVWEAKYNIVCKNIYPRY